MQWSVPDGGRRDHLRRVIEHRTGRPLVEIVRKLYREQSQTPAQMACACTRLAGEKVAVNIVEEWLEEFSLSDREERWAAMVPRLKTLLDRLIDEEVGRRTKDGGPRESRLAGPRDG